VALCFTTLKAHNIHLTSTNGTYAKVRIYCEKSFLSTLIENGVGIDHGTHRGDVYYECELNKRDMKIMDNMGIAYEVVYADVNDFYKEQALINQLTRAAANCTTTGGTGGTTTEYTVPTDYVLGTYQGFFTYSELIWHLDNMALKYPNLITSKAPISNFQTHEGRDINWLKISDNPNVDEGATEKQVLFTALHHAREPMSMMQLVFFMYYLLENYNTDPLIQQLVNHTELYLVPCVNPDGYIYNQQQYNGSFSMWRKNGRDNDGDGNFWENNDGVDLNRNYDYNWGPGFGGSSTNPSSDTYHGPAGNSEPEVQAVQWLTEQHNFVLALNYHAYGNYLIHPWGYANVLTSEDATFKTMGEAMTKENNFALGTTYETLNYTANGASDDWMYGETTVKNKIYAYTPEVGSSSDGFYPSSSRIIPLCQSTMLQNINALRVVNNFYEVTDLNGGTVTGTTDTLHFDVKRFGLQNDNPILTVSSNTGTILQPASGSFTLGLGNETTIEVVVLMPNNVNHNDVIDINIDISYDTGFVDEYTFNKNYILGLDNPSIAISEIVDENGDALTNWTYTGNWGMSSSEYYSDFSSYGDSPNGGYSNSQNSYIRYNGTIDLTDATLASLSFWAKWDIEDYYDYVQIKAINLANNSETTLCGNYTTTGNYYISNDEPIYDNTQNTWVNEVIDLSDFLGQEITIQFDFFSDNIITGDGFYFDDFKVMIDEPRQDFVVIMEGFYDNAMGEMSTSLFDNGLLPANHPYNQAPYYYNGTETISGVSLDGIVDWVLVQARDASNVVIETQAALLRKDGYIVDTNGYRGLKWNPGTYIFMEYVSVSHKSHLAFLSSQTVQNERDFVDFTSAYLAQGTEQLKDVSGTFCMYAGDYDGNGVINNLDYNRWAVENATVNDYLTWDGDGNGLINNLDYNIWDVNKSKVGVTEVQL